MSSFTHVFVIFHQLLFALLFTASPRLLST